MDTNHPGKTTTNNAHYPNDQWTLELEDLGFQDDAEELAKMTLLCNPPFAIAVNGRWGSGKTSLMRYAMAYLGGDTASVRLPLQSDDHQDSNFTGEIVKINEKGKALMKDWTFFPLFADETPPRAEEARVMTLWFSAWSYQHEANLMIPLLHALREQFTRWMQYTDKLKKTGRAIGSAAIDVLGYLADTVSTTLGFKTKAFSEIPKAARQALAAIDVENMETKTDTERFNLLFEHAVSKMLSVPYGDDKDNKKSPQGGGESKHRLVIFIDDLDRCEGSVVVKLLEVIKLYLSTRYCVFVLGLDFTAVEHAIEYHWKDHPKGLAREYLDKLFQVVQHMPVSRQYPQFIHKYLLQQPKLLAAPVDEESTHPSKLAQLLSQILEPNPRKVKNFLNALLIAWILAKDRHGLSEKDLPSFAMIQKLRLQAPSTYAFLCQSPQEHLTTFGDFLASCFSRGPIDEKAGLDVKELFIHDWGHLADDKESRLGVRELRVRLERLASDRRFAQIWHVGDSSLDLEQMTTEQFCKCTGLPEGDKQDEVLPRSEHDE